MKSTRQKNTFSQEQSQVTNRKNNFISASSPEPNKLKRNIPGIEQRICYELYKQNGATNSDILRGIVAYEEKINTTDYKAKLSPVSVSG